jgi:multimeric flavodoxin WrbA
VKRLLGVIGSPRKLGNCELLVKEIAARVPGEKRLSLVRMPDKEILPCRACYRCLAGECPLTDEFDRVLEAIASADGVIVAAPAYLRGANSSLQRFLDRGLQFKKHAARLDGKPAVAVATAGVKGGEGYALPGVENFVRVMGMRLKGRALVHAALPGEALLSEEGRSAAARLAGALFGPGDGKPEGPCCPECGGTCFDLRGGSRAYCLSCGAGVDLGTDAGGGLRVAGTVSPPHLRAGREAQEAHKAWLSEMKAKFLREKDRLKGITRLYEGGEFI